MGRARKIPRPQHRAAGEVHRRRQGAEPRGLACGHACRRRRGDRRGPDGVRGGGCGTLDRRQAMDHRARVRSAGRSVPADAQAGARHLSAGSARVARWRWSGGHCGHGGSEWLSRRSRWTGRRGRQRQRRWAGRARRTNHHHRAGGRAVSRGTCRCASPGRRRR